MCIVDSSLFAEKEPDMLTPFTVLMPANIRFGRGQAESAAPWLAQQGGPILLVHGASPQRAAFLRQQLETLQLAVTTLAISREPWLSDIEQGVQLAREKGIRAVVSLGGGAVIDAGKAIAALVPAAGPVIDYLEVVGTGRQLEASPLPFVAIPTTAGTGAEVTKNAVINVPEQQRKVSLRDDRMLPDLAIVDPALTDNAPRSITLSSGLDALTQVIEPWLQPGHSLHRCSLPAGDPAGNSRAKNPDGTRVSGQPRRDGLGQPVRRTGAGERRAGGDPRPRRPAGRPEPRLARRPMRQLVAVWPGAQ